MRKDLADMNDDEKRAELAFQREHFAHLVSDLECPAIPKTRLGKWWLEWGEFVMTTVKIVVYTAIVCAAVTGSMFAVVLLTAL